MRKLLFYPLLGVLLLAGCGDSGSDSRPLPQPPVASEIVAVGPISGFGSIHLDGHKFVTGSATVTMDDEPATLADLRIGMLVSVRGTVARATGEMEANEIKFS